MEKQIHWFRVTFKFRCFETENSTDEIEYRIFSATDSDNLYYEIDLYIKHSDFFHYRVVEIEKL